MSRESELQRLIKEQELDSQDGNVQRPESGVLRLDGFVDRLQSDGTFAGEQSHSDRLAQRWQCKVHGTEHMVSAPPSWQRRGIQFWCGECNREHSRQHRAVHKPWKRDVRKEANREEARRYRQRKKEEE